MKIILSIPLLILILFSGVIVNFAYHSCEGSVVATNVSLTGKVAMCGMENPVGPHSSDIEFSQHCCDNEVCVYSICNNYFPSSFNFNEQIIHDISLFIVPSDYLKSSEIAPSALSTNIRPPGRFSSNSISLPALCIFRI